MPDYSLRPVQQEEAEAMSSWRYEPPFDWYEPGPAELYLHFDEKAGDGYLALTDHLDIAVGFVCLGAEARVGAQQAADDVVDVGIGVDPQLTSSGIATRAIPIVLNLLAGTLGDRQLRVAIWAENSRAVSTARRAGFTLNRTLEGPGGRSFLEMVRPPPDPGP